MNYFIPKGFHYCINFIPCIQITRSYTLTKNVTFDPSMKYKVTEPSGVNKLFGKCYGLFGVHKESDRFGWCYDDVANEFKIYSYSYHNGRLIKDCIFRINAEDTTELTLTLRVDFIDDARYVRYFINSEYVSRSYYSNSYSSLMFGLGPYFGGNDPAPKNITLKIN